MLRVICLGLVDRERNMAKKIRCYAEGRDGQWQAFCLNFDLAVQGTSLDDVRHDLEAAISMYLDYVSDLPIEEQAQFLRRRAPLGHWLKFTLISLCSLVWGHSKRRAESWAEPNAQAPA